MQKPDFLSLLKEKIIIADGAMGTYLYQKGVSPQILYEKLNLENPELISEIHREYIEAGAELIETNTFSANRTKLKIYSLQDKFYDINFKGAELAVKIASKYSKPVYVAGSIGPLARSLPEETLTRDEIFNIYDEQVKALLDGGVDLFILETFSNLEHIKIALEVCKKRSNLPVICQMAFIEGKKTSYGYNLDYIVGELEKNNADIIGANCGSGPVNILEVITEMAKITNKFISSQPNSGYPQIIDGRTMYLSNEEYFSNYALLLIEKGSNIIGGCCGTTPKYISFIKEKLKYKKPLKRIVERKIEFKEELFTFSKLEEKVKEKKFVVIIEMSPPRNKDIEKYIEKAKLLKENGAEILSFSENPLAQVRMSSIAIASIIKNKTGLETIFHYTCRDRNLIGLQSDLLGAYALGLNTVLAVTGDPSSIGANPEATSVFDLNSIKLVELITNMNKIQQTRFYTGVAFNPNVKNLDNQIERLKKKINNGAKFVMTQPVFSSEKILHFYNKLKDRGIDIPVFFGILLLASKKNTEFLHNEVPGISIPDDIRKRMDIGDKLKEEEEGINIALEIINDVKEKISGIYLIPPLGKYDIAVKILNKIL